MFKKDFDTVKKKINSTFQQKVKNVDIQICCIVTNALWYSMNFLTFYNFISTFNYIYCNIEVNSYV